MSRINLTDNTMTAITKMAEGNPGAVMALMEIMQNHDEIDPQAAMGGLGAIMILDTWKIYGADIYVLYNDKCDRDVRKLLMLMRAVQLGNFSELKLQKMASDHSREINLSDDDFAELDKLVCDRLEHFKKAS